MVETLASCFFLAEWLKMIPKWAPDSSDLAKGVYSVVQKCIVKHLFKQSVLLPFNMHLKVSNKASSLEYFCSPNVILLFGVHLTHQLPSGKK